MIIHLTCQNEYIGLIKESMYIEENFVILVYLVTLYTLLFSREPYYCGGIYIHLNALHLAFTSSYSILHHNMIIKQNLENIENNGENVIGSHCWNFK